MLSERERGADGDNLVLGRLSGGAWLGGSQSFSVRTRYAAACSWKECVLREIGG